MAKRVVMPRLSLTMKEGTVGTWYKKEGEPVNKGEPLLEVLSEKATYDLEAPATGFLRKILVQEGYDTPVNAVLAVITAEGEELTESEIALMKAPEAKIPEEKVLASPAAKRLARDLGVELSQIAGTGPQGRVVEKDVRVFIDERAGSAPVVKEVIQLTGYQKVSAERLSQSFQTAPHSTVAMEADVTEASALHRKLDVSYTSIITKASAKSLVKHPHVNSTLDGDRIKVFEKVNISIAVATEKGLVAPVIQDADQKTLKEISENIRRLKLEADNEKLTNEDLAGGTFTITNLGMYGVDFFLPIINPPEAAILAVGRIAERPVVVNGEILARPIMRLTLTYDHRVIDGATAADFLRTVKQHLEKPEDLEH